MVVTMNNSKPNPQRTQEGYHRPPTVIIVYDQPKVVVERHYTKTFVPHVNPVEYEHRFSNVLLDTSTLLDLVRRLNIREDEITPPPYRQLF
ncbi:unnamed protein product [Adineta ricciae]|uniref:Uncharacterized protein n=1 Tax=Adineta ricciae TaxID=249248 RepID=A0A813R0N8_ADIRI|nr:unnamed protein product [Adineta ricciae]CAF0774198.1 unnamed protein product [Adineta ricciae]